MELLKAYPNHGQHIGLLLDFFYSGMKSRMKSIASSLSGGKLLDKTHEESMEFLASMAMITR